MRPTLVNIPPEGDAVTESEWHGATSPVPMLAFLRGQGNDRRLRFFTYHCCRLAWPTIADERSRCAVNTAERFMAGMATEEQLAVATREARVACDEAYATETNRPPGEYSAATHSLALGTAI